MITIPKFNDDRIKFVIFIQNNRDIFDDLLLSGKYYLTRGLNDEYIIEAYKFFIGFDLGDDANCHDLIYNLDGFNPGYDDDYQQTDINLIINEFQKWLQTDKVITYFKTKYNANKLLPQLHEKIEQFDEKRRTLARTARIKNELDDIGYVPDDRQNSIKETIYRSTKANFNENKTRGGGKKKKKTKKTKKNKKTRCWK